MITKLIPVLAISMIFVFGATQSAFAGATCVASPQEELISASPNPSEFFNSQTADWCDQLDDATYYFPNPFSFQLIAYDPNAGPWVKTLNEPIPAPPSDQGFSDVVVEDLIIAPNSPAWTDWHEEIQTPDWFWGEVFVYVDGNVYIDTIGGQGVQFLNNGNFAPGAETDIWIDFVPPLEPGTEVFIEKQINFPNFNQGPVTFPVIIEEYPTVSPVGGVGLPVDSVSLLLASASSMTLWMIPVIAGIGVGVFVIKRRF